MTESVGLQNFKCFGDTTIHLAPLTLLTGINGTGKSTVIQALASLRQSFLANALPGRGLLLNGELATLGSARDVLHEYAAEDVVGISLGSPTSGAATWRFDASQSDEDLLPLLDGPTELPDHPLFRPGVFHLGAERIGPRVLYPMSAHAVRTRDDIHSDGALAVAWLHENQAVEVEAQLRHAAADGPRMREQVARWMQEIAPDVRIAVAARSDLQIAELSFAFDTGGVATRAYRPVGVGFGLSYTLPVVVACLAGRPDRLALIENPEAHLHPRGQMAMGDLAARAAAAGARMVIETHSDHVLNGVRIAVRAGLLRPEDVAIHFFRRESTPHGVAHTLHSPRLDADGRLDVWPDGFFDQYDIALEQLL